jgi:integrase
MRFTERAIKALRPANGDIFAWDAALAGFGLRMKPSGRASYLIQYRTRTGATRRMVLGPVGTFKVEEARARARKLLVAARDGEDPSADRKADRGVATMRGLCERFLRDHAEPRSKPSYLKQQRRMIETRIIPALGGKAVADVTRADVVALHNGMRESPYEANRVLALLSVIFRQAEIWRLRPEASNPCRLIPRYPEKRRERLLTDDEVARIHAALAEAERTDTEPASAVLAIRLLFATACRAGEIVGDAPGLQWDYLRHDTREIAWPDSKSGFMVKPLTREAAALLKGAKRIVGNPHVCVNGDRDGALPLSSLQKVWARILKRAKVAHCGLHAIRHRAATDIANNPDIPVHVGMRLTGHKTVSTYLRYLHVERDRVRKAAEKVSAQRQAMVKAKAKAAKAGNVVALAAVRQ